MTAGRDIPPGNVPARRPSLANRAGQAERLWKKTLPPSMAASIPDPVETAAPGQKVRVKHSTWAFTEAAYAASLNRARRRRRRRPK